MYSRVPYPAKDPKQAECGHCKAGQGEACMKSTQGVSGTSVSDTSVLRFAGPLRSTAITVQRRSQPIVLQVHHKPQQPCTQQDQHTQPLHCGGSIVHLIQAVACMSDNAEGLYALSALRLSFEAMPCG